MAGEVHGEQEEGQLLHHADAALVGQGEGQGLHLRGLLSRRRRLRVQRGPGPLRRAPETDQVLKVLLGERGGSDIPICFVPDADT